MLTTPRKTIRSDNESYQEEIKSLRDNLHRNNYTEIMTSALRNIDRWTENGTRKLTSVCLIYIERLSKKFERYAVHIVSRKYSQAAWLFDNDSAESTQYNLN